MPDTEPTRKPVEPGEWIVLDLLLDREEQRPWSVNEVALAIGNPVAAADAIANLQAAGLVHQTSDGFVFVTRAAAHFNELIP
ncbi:MAG TPA: hypothetical protein VES65_10850 [Solirubrobacteraceae bacterium]|nr:hypothetical protein [Solirubrobacteraceae bacterium]